MDAFEIAERFEISLEKARKIAKAVSVRTGRKDERAGAMRLKLSRDLQLSVAQLLTLLNDGSLYHKLGKYEDRARGQTFALGNVRAGIAPPDVTKQIRAAATGERESVQIIMRWLKSVLPPWPVRYHWVAVRLLCARLPQTDGRDLLEVCRALDNVRARADFSGWSSKMPAGPYNPVFYHRPKLVFDL